MINPYSSRGRAICQAGENAYGAPDKTWGLRSETELSATILEVDTTLLKLNGPPLDVLTPDATNDAGQNLGGTYNPNAPGAPVTIYATGIRNAFTLFFDSQGTLWAPANGSSAGGNTPAGGGAPALTNVQQVEEDFLFKVQQGAYYGHPDPVRNQFVLDQGNPATGAIPGLAYSAYPVGTNPDPNYQLPNYIFGLHNSPDGMIQYEGSAFGGALNGKFLVTEYSAGSDIVALTPDANDDIIGGLVSTASGPGPNRSITGLNNLSNPVSLVEDPRTGYLYVAELGSSKLILLKPESITPQISASTNVVAFNTIAAGFSGAATSRVESVTITNNGLNPLTFGTGAFSIIDDPNAPGNASNFSISNSGSLPKSLASGQSATVQLKFTATALGIQSAQLQIVSSDPNNTTATVQLNGIGTQGQFGTLEPSLVQVLRAFDIPTIVGAGPNDSDSSNPLYPINPDPSSQEVFMPRLVAATSGPVTITPLAAFNAAVTPSVRFGYYLPGNPSEKTELFTVSKADDQTVSPNIQGANTINLGTGTPFSLYAQFPGVSTSDKSVDTHYSEDQFNTLDPSHPRKFRFFPYKLPDGTVVPNSYIVAAEDFNDPTQINSFINFLGIISNVMPAPNNTSAPVFGVTLPSVPNTSSLVFNVIQTPNAQVADLVHNTNTFQINNTGDQTLTINSITLSDPADWQIVSAPTEVLPGQSANVVVQFIANKVLAHSSNETNTGTTTNGLSVQNAGSVYTGTLTITTNAPINATRALTLNGYWQAQSEHENEPGLQTLVNLMFNYQTVIANTGITASHVQQYPNASGDTVPATYGEEVANGGLWVAADPGQQVFVRQLAAFHQQFDSSNTPTSMQLAWYVQNNSSNPSFLSTAKDGNYEGQSVLPFVSGSTNTPARGTFNTQGTFGWLVDGEFSQDSLNSADIAAGKSGHSVRFWPLRDSSGNIVPNAWIMGMDYQNGTGIVNDDYQDGVYVITNMSPAGIPPTPEDASAAVGTKGVTLRWSPSNGATGYNVYSVAANGARTLLTSSPTSNLFFTDTTTTAAAGNITKYMVTAVNSSGTESVGATATINLQSVNNGVTTVVPGVPVIGSADGSSGTNVVVTWSAPTGATTYVLQREGPGQSSFTTIASGLSSTTYSDTNVTQGATYTYQVQAVNSVGSSAFSAPMSATVAMTMTAPLAPTITSADGSMGNVALSWTTSAGATSYDVQRQDPGQSTFHIVATGLTSTNVTDTGVAVNSTYTYEVQAVNGVGLSPFSAPAVVTVNQPLSAPSAPTNLQTDVSTKNQVILNWGASMGAASYRVERQNPGAADFTEIASGVTSASFVDTSVVAGAIYHYRVRAQNAAGFSGYTNTATAILPPPPQSLDVTVGNGANKSVRFVDIQNSLVTIKLNGAGTATVHFSADTISQSTTTAGVVVSGSNITLAGISTTATAKNSTLMVTTTGGNKTVNIGGIIADASLNIVAPTATLIGDSTIAGSSTRISLGAATAAIMSVGGAIGQFQVGAVTGVTLTAGGLIRTVTSNSWNSNHAISAPAITNINIKHDADLNIVTGVVRTLHVGGILHDSDLTLSTAGALDLVNLTAGEIVASTISTAGNIGTISAAIMMDSSISAGLGPLPSGQNLPQSPSDFSAAAVINNINLKKLRGANSFVNSNIAASQIKRLSLGQIQFSNGSNPFGVAALGIASLSGANPANGKPFTFTRLTGSDVVAADFAKKGISPLDFVVEIV